MHHIKYTLYFAMKVGPTHPQVPALRTLRYGLRQLLGQLDGTHRSTLIGEELDWAALHRARVYLYIWQFLFCWGEGKSVHLPLVPGGTLEGQVGRPGPSNIELKVLS